MGKLFGAVEAKELGLINESVPRQNLKRLKKRYLSDLKECSPSPGELPNK